jgi:hypothetical protein
MGTRETSPVTIPAGVVKGRGKLEAMGRWIDMDKVRFAGGKPEKIGGWIKKIAAQFIGIARAAHSWNDLLSRSQLAIGTTQKLYASTDAGLIDITPAQNPGGTVLTNAFTTVNGSKTVKVTLTNHQKIVGQGIELTAATVGGLPLAGKWIISSIVGTNDFAFEHTQLATSSAGPTGTATATFDLTPGTQNPAGGFGYGVGGYGSETYGTPRSSTSILFEPYYWRLDHFGKILLGAPFQGGLYSWDPATFPVVRAALVTNGTAGWGPPGAMRGCFVTPERFVFALGCSAGPIPGDTSVSIDPMLVRWCTQADYTMWFPTATNTANSRRLTEGKRIMGGAPLAQSLSLIWTDTTCYAFQYTGSRFVFDSRIVGTKAGLAGPNAFTIVQGRAFWYGSGNFFGFSGGIAPLPNQVDVREWLNDQMRANYETKTVCFYCERFNEVWWLFACGSSDEPNVYVAYSLEDGTWIHGTLTRTAAFTVDGGDTRPHLVGADGYIYVHEEGTDADGVAMEAYIESGPFQMANGGVIAQALGFVPDFSEQEGDVQLSVEARDRANGRVIDRNVASIAPTDSLVDLRVRGRVMSIRLSQSMIGGTFALGEPAIETMLGGKKR